MNDAIEEIFTEDPDFEQWQTILRFAYPDNIKKFFGKKNVQIEDDDLLETIAGSISQAHEYFEASKMVSLDISPLLLYYGVSNLLFGVSCLITGKLINIQHHGMRLRLKKDSLTRIADVEIIPLERETGALMQFISLFAKNSHLAYGVPWTIQEVVASIPDLKQDFETCYSDRQAHTIPVQVVKRKNDYLERVKRSDIERYEDPNELFARIQNFSACYLQPQCLAQGDYVILRKKLGGKTLGVYSVSGQKFLQIPHLKGRRQITLPTIIHMYMDLFAFGFLSRYHPAIWSPFVRSDSTGEKQLIEKFINTCRRFLPNLALNVLYQKRIHFIPGTQGTLDLSKDTTESELKEMISQGLKDILESERRRPKR